jgi:DNA-binding NarL/FixJ family response regulator
MTMFRLLVVDDQLAFRQPLAFLLDREPDFAVVAQAATLAEARNKLADVDVAVVDLGLPDGNGAELVEPLREANPDGRILLLSSLSAEPEAGLSTRDGIGMLDKSRSLSEIISSVRRLGNDAGAQAAA